LTRTQDGPTLNIKTLVKAANQFRNYVVEFYAGLCKLLQQFDSVLNRHLRLFSDFVCD